MIRPPPLCFFLIYLGMRDMCCDLQSFFLFIHSCLPFWFRWLFYTPPIAFSLSFSPLCSARSETLMQGKISKCLKILFSSDSHKRNVWICYRSYQWLTSFFVVVETLLFWGCKWNLTLPQMVKRRESRRVRSDWNGNTVVFSGFFFSYEKKISFGGACLVLASCVCFPCSSPFRFSCDPWLSVKSNACSSVFVFLGCLCCIVPCDASFGKLLWLVSFIAILWWRFGWCR